MTQKKYIWGANGKRRQMSKGQMAMIAAQSFVAKDYGEKVKAARLAGVSEARFNYALTVREHAPHLGQDVIDGKPKATVDAAYAIAVENKRAKQQRDSDLATLRSEDPDLAQKVDDREMTLDDAGAQLMERKEFAAKAEANKRENLLRLSETWRGITACPMPAVCPMRREAFRHCRETIAGW
jgi:cobalamin biosynthesis protein CbiG